MNCFHQCFTPNETLMLLLSETNTTLAMKDGHPLLYMSGGSNCPNSEYQATTAVQFVCDKSVFAAGKVSKDTCRLLLAANTTSLVCPVSGKPELIAQMPDDDATACAFVIEWRTHVSISLFAHTRHSSVCLQFACPHGERGLLSSIVVVLVLMSVFGHHLFYPARTHGLFIAAF